ncbi:MAG: response regulator [Deltaproteobacteria bacterium]|nr:response regulator [Deltaproteobacteria bacterium]
MSRRFTLLIADRNPHVREFLKREMTAEGFVVRLARNGLEVMQSLFKQGPPDLLILDLDLPDSDEMSVLDEIQTCFPNLPVVVHTFLSECTDRLAVLQTTAVVEKQGNNVDRLKKVVMRVLQESYLRRIEPEKRDWREADRSLP